MRSLVFGRDRHFLKPISGKLTMADATGLITDAAGVSSSQIYHYFADKDELFAAAYETAVDQAPFERAISEIDPAAPFEQRLMVATELIQRRIVDIWRLVSQLGPRHHPSSPKPLPDSPALAALLGAEAARLRIEPVDAARLLRALTLSFSHPMLSAEPRPVADIVDVFLHGVDVDP
jgi:AcrR family transcriptional regulator